MIRVGIAAPSPAFRAGLRALLLMSTTLIPGPEGNSGPGMEIIFETDRLADEVRFLTGIDVLVTASEAISPLDLRRFLGSMPEHPGFLLITDDRQAVQRLARLPLSAWGALPLDCSPEELTAAVVAISEGLWAGSPALMETTVRAMAAEPEGDESDFTIEALTDRESQVLQLLARGLANKQIAAALGISEHTVKFHVSSIFTRLGVTNRTEAVRLGVQHGLISL